MSTDLQTFFTETYVALFNRGVACLTERVAEGEEGEAAQAILDDVRGARGASRFVFEGDASLEIWLSLNEGEMSAVEERPEGVPMRLAVTMPREAGELWMEELSRRVSLDSDEAATRLARGASKRIEDALGDESLDFHLILKDTPDFDEVVVRVALHAESPPATPTFTATVRWDDLEEMSQGQLDLQRLMMGGKLKLGGDYTRAMQVALELMNEARR